MKFRLAIIAAILGLYPGWLGADVRARSVSIAVVFEPDNGADEGWWEGFRSSLGQQVVVTDFRTGDAWGRALAAKPALALLQSNTRDCEALRRRISRALKAGTVPVMVAGGAGADVLRQFAESYKITLIDTGSSAARHRSAREAGIDAARQLVRLQTQLQPFLRVPSGRDVEVTVSQDGHGDFKTIQYAIDHAPPVGPGERLIIHIQPGTYRERVVVPRDRPRVTLRGTDPKSTIVSYRMGANDAGGTFLTATVHVAADDFEAENITLENTFGVGSQAVALHLQSDRAVIRNCRLIGWQDTLYAASGRQYFKDCYVEGYVDFIFGNAAAVFENCEIRSLGSGYIAAQSRTQPDTPTGFVFDRCRLTAKGPSIKVHLARPWRPYSRVIFSRCWMDKHIVPGGWDNWGSMINEKTAVFAEYECSGPGAQTEQRVGWARHITKEEADSFGVEPFLCGVDHWDPREDSTRQAARE